MEFKDKRFLVTGGAGFIGSEVIKQLLQKGSDVTILDNFSSGKKEYLPKNKKNLKVIKGSITDSKIVKKAVILVKGISRKIFGAYANGFQELQVGSYDFDLDHSAWDSRIEKTRKNSKYRYDKEQFNQIFPCDFFGESICILVEA